MPLIKMKILIMIKNELPVKAKYFSIIYTTLHQLSKYVFLRYFKSDYLQRFACGLF